MILITQRLHLIIALPLPHKPIVVSSIITNHRTHGDYIPAISMIPNSSIAVLHRSGGRLHAHEVVENGVLVKEIVGVSQLQLMKILEAGVVRRILLLLAPNPLPSSSPIWVMHVRCLLRLLKI